MKMNKIKKRWPLFFALVTLMIIATTAFTGCNEEDRIPVVLINLGDSLTHGVQSGGGNVNEFTQENSFPEVLAAQLDASNWISLTWANPYLEMDWTTREKSRIDDSIIPYNLGVDGATIQSLLTQKSSPESDEIINEVVKPIPSLIGHEVTQLEAAEYVASLHPNEFKLFTLFIGNNDTLGAVTGGGGTMLDTASITAYLEDSEAGHDLHSIQSNLKKIVKRLAKVKRSQVLIATLPYVTGAAFLFNEQDLEDHAAFADADVTVLAEGQSLGFGPVIGNPCSINTSITRALATNNPTLNALVAGTVMASDGFSLTAEEAALVNTRIDEVNAYIHHLAACYFNVAVVDVHAFFNRVVDGEIYIGGDMISRSFGGGLFSLDGFHASNTGYALLANEFVKKINKISLIPIVPEVDLQAVWDTDPYRDLDGDGFAPGPFDLRIIDPALVPYADPDDTDSTVLPSYVTGFGLPCS